MRSHIPYCMAAVLVIASPGFCQDKPNVAAPIKQPAKQTSTKPAKRPAKKPDIYDTSVPKPTESMIRYGDHQRYLLDFWKADSDTPTPLAFIIHGGGWQGGSKERANRFADVAQLLKAGLSVTSLNYRYVRQAVEQGIEPPVKAMCSLT